jgi:hypothetical protein
MRAVAKSKSTDTSIVRSEKDGEQTRPKNALVHGFYAEDVLLPWESAEEFGTLLTELEEEFQPDGRMEKEVVFDLAHLRWQKQRLRKMWHAAAIRDPFVSDLVESGKQSYPEIREHLRSQASEVRSLTEAARSSFLQFAAHVNKLHADLLKSLKDEPGFKANRKEKSTMRVSTVEMSAILKELLDREKSEAGGSQKAELMENHDAAAQDLQDASEIKQDRTEEGVEARESRFDDEQDGTEMRSQIQQRIDSLGLLTTEGLTGLIKALESLPGAERTLAQAYSPEYLEPVIRIEASIDARIDKLLGRLVSLKQYKRLEASYKKPTLIAKTP